MVITQAGVTDSFLEDLLKQTQLLQTQLNKWIVSKDLQILHRYTKVLNLKESIDIQATLCLGLLEVSVTGNTKAKHRSKQEKAKQMLCWKKDRLTLTEQKLVMRHKLLSDLVSNTILLAVLA